MSDMFLNFSAFVEREVPAAVVFGLEISRLDADGVIARIVAPMPLLARPGARVFAAPDLRHVALMRRDRELHEALASADLVTCGGVALLHYARLRGCTPPRRVTAREVVDRLLRREGIASGQRLFFLLECEATAAAVRVWAASRDMPVLIEIAARGFDADRTACAQIAARAMAFGATILVLGVDTPAGELFAARHREQLPEGCWALCVADAVGASLGVAPAPKSKRQRETARSSRGPWQPARRFSAALAFALWVYRDLTTESGKQSSGPDPAGSRRLEQRYARP